MRTARKIENAPTPHKLHNVTVDYGDDNNSYNNKINDNQKERNTKGTYKYRREKINTEF